LATCLVHPDDRNASKVTAIREAHFIRATLCLRVMRNLPTRAL